MTNRPPQPHSDTQAIESLDLSGSVLETPCGDKPPAKSTIRGRRWHAKHDDNGRLKRRWFFLPDRPPGLAQGILAGLRGCRPDSQEMSDLDRALNQSDLDLALLGQEEEGLNLFFVLVSKRFWHAHGLHRPTGLTRPAELTSNDQCSELSARQRYLRRLKGYGINYADLFTTDLEAKAIRSVIRSFLHIHGHLGTSFGRGMILPGARSRSGVELDLHKARIQFGLPTNRRGDYRFRIFDG
jgi:hypothetical protein